MKALAACVLVAFAAALAAGVEPGRACSCALPDPRAALAQADGAFVGELVSRRQGDQQAVLTFSVDKTLKGAIGRTVEVTTAANSAGCGIEAPIGTRVGLVLERRDGTWHGHLCWTFTPPDLLAAANPLPAPNGRGPAAMFVGAQLGGSRLMALDRRGRTLSYGRGAGWVSQIAVCPGKQRLVELASSASGTELVVRRARTLRVLRRQSLRLPDSKHVQRLACEDAHGASVIVFARGPTDSPIGSVVYRTGAGRLRALWKGAAYDAEITPLHVYLSAGTTGRNLFRLSLDASRVRHLATLPGPTTSLAVNADGTLLAGVHSRLDAPSQLVRVDLTGPSRKVATTPLTRPEVPGQVFWLPMGRLLFVPSYNGEAARVLDSSLRTRSRFRWTAASAALVGTQVFGIDQTSSLYRATLPSSPMLVARRLPGRPTVIVSASG